MFLPKFNVFMEIVALDLGNMIMKTYLIENCTNNSTWWSKFQIPFQESKD